MFVSESGTLLSINNIKKVIKGASLPLHRYMLCISIFVLEFCFSGCAAFGILVFVCYGLVSVVFPCRPREDTTVLA